MGFPETHKYQYNQIKRNKIIKKENNLQSQLYLQKTIVNLEEIIKIIFKIQFQDKIQSNLHKANLFQLI